jgi:uncharacterized RmlC-like cupin family protein
MTSTPARPDEAVCRIVRGGEGYEGRQGLSYAAGISAESVGAQGLCLHSLTIRPAAARRRTGTSRTSRRSTR